MGGQLFIKLKLTELVELQQFGTITEQKFVRQMRNKSHEDSASFVLYQKIRMEPLRSSQRVTLFDLDGNKAVMARQYFQLGNEYYKKADYKTSIGYYQSSLKYSYQCPQTHNNLGVLMALTHEQQLSIDYFNKSIQLRPKQIFAYINLANIQIKNERYSKGIQIYLELMTQYKEKRVMDNFNKIIKHYNCFSKFLKKNIRSAHADINRSTLEEILKLVMEKIAKLAPMTQQLVSFQNVVDQSHIQTIKNIFQNIKINYSKLHLNHLKSQFNCSRLIKRQLQQYLKVNENPTIHSIICLLFSYFFIENQEIFLSFSFNSMIDGKKQEKQYLKDCYLQLYSNYVNLKRVKILPYLIESKSSTQQFDPQFQKNQIVHTIERLYFHDKLILYLLNDLFTDPEKIKNLDEKETEIHANATSTLQNYYELSAFLFKSYKDKNSMGKIYDYQFEESLYFLYFGDDKIQHEEIFTRLDRELDLGQCSVSRQIQFITNQAFCHFQNKEYQKAIDICENAMHSYPQKQDMFYQFLGAIYLLKFSSSRKHRERTINHEKAIQMYKTAITKNPKNYEALFQLHCISFLIRLHRSLTYLIRAIQADPQQLRFFTQLALVYNSAKQHRFWIKQFVSNLKQEYTKATDFKVKGNIAIFHLFIQDYQQSYSFLKFVLKQGAKEDDTNCEDLLMMYFISKLMWLYIMYIDEEHSCRIQLGLYLIIFIKSPFLFEKYDQQTYLFDEHALRYIHYELTIQISKNCNRLIETIEKFDPQHKSIVYVYIFKEIFKGTHLDPLQFYTKIIQFDPTIKNSLWTYEIVVELKQAKLQKIKELKDYMSSEEKKRPINQQFRNFPFFKINEIIRKNSQFTSIKKKIEQYINKLSQKQKCQASMHLIYKKILLKRMKILKMAIQSFNNAQDTAQLTQVAQQFKNNSLYIEIILLVFRYFYVFLSQNHTLMRLTNYHCRKFLKSHNFDEFYIKLKNFIFEDYVSSNSKISIYKRDLDDIDTEYSNLSQQNENNQIIRQAEMHQASIKEYIQSVKIQTTWNYYQCCQYSTEILPEIHIFTFAVSLVNQFEKSGIMALQLRSFDFQRDQNFIHFCGKKKLFKVALSSQAKQEKNAFEISRLIIKNYIYKKNKYAQLQKQYKASRQFSIINLLNKIKFIQIDEDSSAAKILEKMGSKENMKSHHLACFKVLANELNLNRHIKSHLKFQFFVKLLLSSAITYEKFIQKIKQIYK